MTERYVRPPLLGQEPSPPWVATLRLRVLAVVLLLVAAYLLLLVFQQVVTGAGEQDPGVNALGLLLRS